MFSKVKYQNIYFVNDGGWHFSNIKNAKALEEKLKTRKQQLNDRINEIEKTDKDLITLLQKLSETDEKLF